MTVKELRHGANMTQREFANYFHMPLRTLQKWECGQANPAGYVLDMMQRILCSDAKLQDE